MATTVKVAEAKAHLSELLVKVEAGEEFVIARGREPVARLIPLEKNRQQDIADAIAGILAIQAQAQPVSQEEIRARRDEGRA